MAHLWEEWLGSEEDWSKSSLALQLSRSHSHERVGARRWMTFTEISNFAFIMFEFCFYFFEPTFNGPNGHNGHSVLMLHSYRSSSR